MRLVIFKKKNQRVSRAKGLGFVEGLNTSLLRNPLFHLILISTLGSLTPLLFLIHWTNPIHINLPPFLPPLLTCEHWGKSLDHDNQQGDIWWRVLVKFPKHGIEPLAFHIANLFNHVVCTISPPLSHSIIHLFSKLGISCIWITIGLLCHSLAFAKTQEGFRIDYQTTNYIFTPGQAIIEKARQCSTKFFLLFCGKDFISVARDSLF